MPAPRGEVPSGQPEGAIGRAQPIRPDQIAEGSAIPDKVIETFNELIKARFNGGTAHILQKDILAALAKKGLRRNVVLDREWLDVEPLYEEAGWDVRYDSPSYGDDNDFEPYFDFTRRTKT